jgi:parallel beta-helix repeat protein
VARAPAAFMSYVRLDDQHEGGQLTEFRTRLSAEVRMQVGSEFPIFQDRNDIAWGQNWRDRIDATLDAVTLLIPIITPSFFRSEPCRDEVSRFLERERRLGRRDLILPIYYVTTTDMDDPDRRDSDDLAGALAERQFADWRELRFEPFTSPVVRRALAQLASRLRDSFWQEFPPKSPAGKASTGIAVVTEDSEQPGTGQTGKVGLAPVAKVEPPTHVVDPFHRGDFTAISAAIKAAQPGDRILVRPGLYQEGVVIDKPLELLGDGPVADIVNQAYESNTVLFQANIGRVANLTLRQAGGTGKWFGVDITQSRLELEGCEISSQGLSCVAIRNGADPRVRRNHIHDGMQAGVYVYDDGLGLLEDNDIHSNVNQGVVITTGGNPTLRRNQIHDNKQTGVRVYDDGLGLLEDNGIYSNASAGVQTKTGGNPTVRRNQIHDNKQSGVRVYDDGLGLLEDNDIHSNTYAGVAIKTGGNPTLRRNQIHDNKESGVRVYDNGLGLLEDNGILSNAQAGVTITTGGNPTLRRNRINRNEYEALWIYAGGAGIVEDNDLRNNVRGPWDLAPDSEKQVQRARNIEK